jgi:hypothetical protein
MTVGQNQFFPQRDGGCAGVPSAFRRFSPELLSPAGDWECARAAVENGADAIYFGLEVFNARMRAKNFTRADLPALMEFLHGRGVRGYLSFNTLVFPGELAEAEQVLRAVIAAGVDAAIVQDVGICRLIRRISPDFPIHASTPSRARREWCSRGNWAAIWWFWRARCRFLRSNRSKRFCGQGQAGRIRCRWRFSCMGRFAWLTRVNA